MDQSVACYHPPVSLLNMPCSASEQSLTGKAAHRFKRGTMPSRLDGILHSWHQEDAFKWFTPTITRAALSHGAQSIDDGIGPIYFLKHSSTRRLYRPGCYSLIHGKSQI
ncbi:Uncharacterized protein HZ326_11918 [Fusarium oxysporum f. sp. albedinis]|nr:Uncharacterized protein HZ326_11918 [Fusarium oxysporum f. sp. albedinis]